MDSVTGSTTESDTHGVPIERRPAAECAAAQIAERPAPTSSLFGLGTRDALVVALGALLVIAYAPFFWADSWTVRACVLLAALPFGLIELVRLAWHRDRAARVACMVVAWAIVTSLVSDAPWLSLLPVSGRNEAAWVMAAAIGCWALGRGLTSAGRRALGVAVVAASALNGLVALVQVILEVDSGPLAIFDGRASGVSGNPVYFGATTAGAAAWCVWFASARARSKRGDLALVGVAFGSALVTMSGSRVALASLAVVAFAVILKHRSRGSLLVVPAIVVGSVVGTLVQRAIGGAGSSATERVGASGLGARFEVWRYGWRALLDRPLTGYGLGSFRPAVQRFFDAEFVTHFQRDDLAEAWSESHNIVVQMTVGMGIVGVALLVMFGALALRSSSGPLVCAAGAIAFTWLLQPARLVTFPLVALLLGASQPMLRDAVVDGRRRIARWLAAVGVVASTTLAGWVIIADLQMRAATSHPSVAASSRAVRWSPWDPGVANEAATLIFDVNAVDPLVADQVLSWNSRATEVEPNFPYWWMRLGIRQMILADNDVARVSFERALDLQPYHPISLRMLSVIATEQGDDELLRLVNGRLEELGFPVETGQTTAGR